MTLASLLRWHYFSIQENTSGVRASDGSFNRKDSWSTSNQNLQGNIQTPPQGRNRDAVVEDYAIREMERLFVIYHNNETVPVGGVDTYIDLTMRVLVHQNPKNQISFDGSGEVTTDSNDVRIFDIVSNTEPVALRSRGLTLFELYIQENPRMSL